jgi:hypothetical protein
VLSRPSAEMAWSGMPADDMALSGTAVLVVSRKVKIK